MCVDVQCGKTCCFVTSGKVGDIFIKRSTKLKFLMTVLGPPCPDDDSKEKEISDTWNTWKTCCPKRNRASAKINMSID